MEILEALAPALVVLVVYRLLAGGKVPVLSPIARFMWNLSCMIGSYIPFIGWICAKLMIVETEGEAMAQKDALETSEVADEWGSELAAKSVARSQEEQHRIEEEAELERRISRETGRSARIHGNTVDIGDKTFDLNDVKKKLNIR